MLSFGQVYWKRGITKNKSPENHFIVVLGVEPKSKSVIYQTLSSKLCHVFHFPKEKLPRIDVDSVSFLNYRKYKFLDRDTCLMMFYGVAKENQSVFEYNVENKRYILKGELTEDNKKTLILILRCATEYRLTKSERELIFKHYSSTRTT